MLLLPPGEYRLPREDGAHHQGVPHPLQPVGLVLQLVSRTHRHMHTGEHTHALAGMGMSTATHKPRGQRTLVHMHVYIQEKKRLLVRGPCTKKVCVEGISVFLCVWGTSVLVCVGVKVFFLCVSVSVCLWQWASSRPQY